MPDVTKQQALTEALRIIDQFVEIAKANKVPIVTLGTFKTIGTIRKVEAR